MIIIYRINIGMLQMILPWYATPYLEVPVSRDRDNGLVFRRPRNYTDNRKRSHEKVAVLREYRKCSLNSLF